MKFTLIIWALTVQGYVADPVTIDGFESKEECLVAAESMTATPKETRTYKIAVVTRCVETP